MQFSEKTAELLKVFKDFSQTFTHSNLNKCIEGKLYVENVENS